MEFEKIVQEELTRMTESGTIRALIATALEKSVGDAIAKSLSSYSAFGKGLGEKIEAAIGVELANVSLQSGALGLAALVEAQVGRYVSEQAHPILMERLAEIFKPAPATITLQDLIDEYRADIADTQGCSCDGAESISLVIKRDPDMPLWLKIGFNPSPTTGIYPKKTVEDVRDCEIQLSARKDEKNDRYHFTFIYFGGYTARSTKDFLPSGLYRFSRRLCQMYVQRTVLLVDSLDAGDYDLSIPA